MSYYQPDIYEGRYWAVETSEGTSFLPVDVVGDLGLSCGERTADASPFQLYVEGRFQSAELCEGVLGRITLPGYLDCSDWATYGSAAEAEESLREDLGED